MTVINETEEGLWEFTAMTKSPKLKINK